MHLQKDCLDDLLREVIELLFNDGVEISATKGANIEINGVLLELTNPLARLSGSEARGKLFSCLGEFFWYMSAQNDLSMITYYLPRYSLLSDDGKTVTGGYGPRLFKMRGYVNQINNCIELLRRKSTSRRAVVQIFNAEDLLFDYCDVPCTCTLQFLVRNRRLQLIAHMRSNDAYLGLPHDIFCFTMLQELVARSLGVGLGTYKHLVGSMHLYEKDIEQAQQFLDEGWQDKVAMPPMPPGDQWDALNDVCRLEQCIRLGLEYDLRSEHLDEYWGQVLDLLRFFRVTRPGHLDADEATSIVRRGNPTIYGPYMRDRLDGVLRSAIP